MRKVLASIIIIAGVFIAVYVGIGLMFVGGIAQVIDAVQKDPVNGSDVAWGAARVVFSGVATALTLYLSLAVAALVAGVRKQF